MTSPTERRRTPPRFQPLLSSRRPEHPGRLLERCYLIPLHISQAELARQLGISRRRINEIVNGQRAISADTALKLSAFFNTTPMFWLEKQQLWELHEAGRKDRACAQPLEL